MVLRILLSTAAALFLGSIAAFFLFVSMLSIVTVVLILTAPLLMFGLGFQVGTRPAVCIADSSR